jgi:hypothetical protein
MDWLLKFGSRIHCSMAACQRTWTRVGRESRFIAISTPRNRSTNYLGDKNVVSGTEEFPMIHPTRLEVGKLVHTLSLLAPDEDASIFGGLPPNTITVDGGFRGEFMTTGFGEVFARPRSSRAPDLPLTLVHDTRALGAAQVQLLSGLPGTQQRQRRAGVCSAVRPQLL